MVRKIIVVALAVCMCFVLCVSASAASKYLPLIPENDYPFNYVFRDTNGQVRLYFTDKEITNATTGPKYNLSYCELYVYDADTHSWDLWDKGNPYKGNFLEHAVYEFLYDSSGGWASDSLKIFGVNPPVSSEDWETVTKQFIGQINVKSVVSVLVVGVSAVIGLVFMWWGGRKLVRAVMIALRKGKVQP